MLDDFNEVSLDEIESSGLEFSPEQKRRIQEIVRERLARQGQKHALDIESVRTEARRQISAVTGEPQSPTQYLQEEQNRRDREAVELSQLETIFGNQPGSGMRATQLKKQNPQQYATLKARYLELKGIQKFVPTPSLGFKG